MQSLFIAYFERGRDLGDTDVLVDIAHCAGMDREAVAQMLDTDDDLEGIKERDASGRKMGLNGVPAFVVAGQHVVQGAQGPDLWTRVIRDITEQMALQAVS